VSTSAQKGAIIRLPLTGKRCGVNVPVAPPKVTEVMVSPASITEPQAWAIQATTASATAAATVLPCDQRMASLSLRASSPKSSVTAEATELSDDESVDMAAAKTAAITSPASPTGSCSTMKRAKT